MSVKYLCQLSLASAGCKLLLVASLCWSEASAGRKPLLVASFCWSQASAGRKPLLVASLCWWQASAGGLDIATNCFKMSNSGVRDETPNRCSCSSPWSCFVLNPRFIQCTFYNTVNCFKILAYIFEWLGSLTTIY